MSKFYPICFVAAPESDVPREGVHAPRQGCLHAVYTTEFKLVLCILPSPLQCGCILILKIREQLFKLASII